MAVQRKLITRCPSLLDCNLVFLQYVKGNFTSVKVPAACASVIHRHDHKKNHLPKLR